MYKEKGSKFLAFAFPVITENAIKEHITALRKEYFDARHHCYAWILGPEKKQFRAADDGEPNHSAGDPILGQIRSKNLTNVLVIVVRYFGGVKLGVGGLVNAYRSAAEDALYRAEIIEKTVTRNFVLQYDYESTAEVMRMVSDFNLQIIKQDFSERCTMALEVPVKINDAFLEKVKLLQSMNFNITCTE